MRSRSGPATVQHDLARLHGVRVDELHRGFLEVRRHVLLVQLAARVGRLAQVLGGEAAHLGDAGLARQRHRAAADQLGARVVLRVVRGGAHQPAVQVARADREVELLGAHLSHGDNVGALVAHAVGVAGRELRGGQPHVAPEPDPQLAGRLVLLAGEHPREGTADPVRHVAVDLLPVEAPDVVGLEDARVDAGIAAHAAGTIASAGGSSRDLRHAGAGVAERPIPDRALRAEANGAARARNRSRPCRSDPP
jgi:hypothetical protein